MTTLPITSRTDWTEPMLREIWNHIDDIGKNDLKLDYYDPQFEIISAEQMLDAYSSVGLPVHYNHWSFGKSYLKNWSQYSKGKMGLALEIVINTNPCISYLMEENNAIAQTLVMAHAACGHAHVFKNNYMFKDWTAAGSIIDYMIFAKKYIRDCEEKFGEDHVQAVLDAAHAIAAQGVDKKARKHRKRMSEEERMSDVLKKADEEQKNLNIILKTTSNKVKVEEEEAVDLVDVDEENLIYFIYKNAPNMPAWQRELLRIVYKVQQYFYPQSQCLTGDNLVSTGNGLIRLDKLITEEGFNPAVDIRLLTKGDKLTDVSHTYKKLANTIKVTTLHGREYIATPEHPLMMLCGTSKDLKKVGDAKLGDYLVIELGYQNIFAKELTSLKIPALSSTSIGKSVNVAEFPKTLNEETARLIAYMHSGSMSRINQASSTITIRQPNKILQDAKALLKSQFAIDLDVESDDFGDRINFSSWSLKQFLIENKLHNDQLHAFEIPEKILASPKSVIRYYLKGLIDTQSIRRFSSSSFELVSYDSEHLRHIQILLTAFGIGARITLSSRETLTSTIFNINDTDSKERWSVNNYTLRINPEFFSTFDEEIGSNLHTAELYREGKSAYSRIIPGGKELIFQIISDIKEYRKDFAEKANLITKGSHNLKIKQGLLLKDNITGILKLPIIRGHELTVSDIKEQIEAFDLILSLDHPLVTELKSLLADYDVCLYDRIVKIEDAGEREVYDVTVPENHLFWVSGLISHNTKVLNEGFATFTHYYILHELEKKGLISADAMIAAIHLHSSVVFQADIHSRYYDGTFNPYALGFAIYKDIKRICEAPTAEDKDWFPYLIGKDWREEIKTGCADFRDESFIEQYLTPRLMRQWKMFSVYNDGETGVVQEICDDKGYSQLRRDLAAKHNTIDHIPDIRVKKANMKGDRLLTLEYHPYNNRSLFPGYAKKTLKHIQYLWGYDIEMMSGKDIIYRAHS